MTDYAEFCRRFHAHFTRNPNHRLGLGVERELELLPDPSRSARLGRIQEARMLLDDLSLVPTSDFDQQLDLELASLFIRAELHNDTYTWAGGTRDQHTPSAGDDIGSGIFLLLTNDPRPAHSRLSDMTGRIERVPEYLSELLARLELPVLRWARMDEQKVTGLSSLFASVRELAAAEAFSDAPRLASAIGHAESALQDYVQRLGALPTTEELHVGEVTTAEIVALRGIELDLKELHRIAREFIAETGVQIASLHGKLTQKYGLDNATSVADLEIYLNRRFAVIQPGEPLSKILEAYREELARCTRFVEQSRLFPVFDEQEIIIMQTPPFMLPSIPAGAMLGPAPFRPGRPTSQIYLTLSDELLDEHTLLSIPSMIIHEAMPGHHLQLANAAQHPSVIRKHFNAMDQAEGWTTMLEDYMLDQGYMQSLTDEARFIGKRDLSRIGARVAIDLFFMTGDRQYLELGVAADVSPLDPFLAAGNLLREVTGFSAPRIEAELNWYSQERGYPLSYLTGNHLVWRLKRAVRASQGGLLSKPALDRRFHEVYLQAGSMPLAALERVFEHEELLDRRDLSGPNQKFDH